MEKDYLKDITEIKDMMNRSSQFLSLSGLSGILAGIYALIGAFIANMLLKNYKAVNYDANRDITDSAEIEIITQLMILAFVVLLIAIVTGLILSYSKARKQNETIWNSSSKRLLINFCIPLAVGGIFSLILLIKGYYELIVPLTLIFYGLACVNASKYTFRNVRYLGLILSLLGILATYFVEYSVILWAMGFGVFHIIYGLVMHLKYDRNA